jgi:hypothetical protein
MQSLPRARSSSEVWRSRNDRYFGGDAAGFALLRGSSAPWDRELSARGHCRNWLASATSSIGSGGGLEQKVLISAIAATWGDKLKAALATSTDGMRARMLANGYAQAPPAREGRRRRFNEADKPQILEEAVQAGANLSEVARGIAARVLFRWK